MGLLLWRTLVLMVTDNNSLQFARLSPQEQYKAEGKTYQDITPQSCKLEEDKMKQEMIDIRIRLIKTSYDETFFSIFTSNTLMLNFAKRRLGW